MMALRASLLAFAAVPLLIITERPVRACGGCFTGPKESTVVTDHRMAFSVSTQQTVLWDQIKYSGSPADFAWVLPVRAGTVVQLSHDEWFGALDAVTSPVITGPVRNCNSGGGGVGCGAAGNSTALDVPGAGDRGVQVISQGVVGPYDTVTLRATDPNALTNWLDSNGYAIPDAFRPTIDAYVSEGFDFIALRLQPGQGVQAMQPVRVVTQGADPTLPLRMVAAGVGAQVDITLYVIGEGRYEAQSPYVNATVDDSQLVWSATQSRSNYQELSQQIMQGNNARTWLTEYAQRTSLEASPYGHGCGGGNFFNGGSAADVYLGLCACLPKNTCDSGASSDAGDSGADAGCNPDPCATFDDIDVALVGMHPADTWVTRLRAILPIDALAEGDLHLQASAPQTSVSNQHATNRYDDPTYSPCGSNGGCSASATETRPLGTWLVVGAFGFLTVALVRRRAARSARGRD